MEHCFCAMVVYFPYCNNYQEFPCQCVNIVVLALRYITCIFAVTVNLGTEAGCAFQASDFVEKVKAMHEERDKGFEEEFKVTQRQHKYSVLFQ